MCSDNILFTWSSWIDRDDRNDGLVTLSPLLRPELSPSDLHIECAIVRLAGRTLSPPAQRLVDLILAPNGLAGKVASCADPIGRATLTPPRPGSS